MAENPTVATINESMEYELSYHTNNSIVGVSHSTSIWQKLRPVDKDRLFAKIIKSRNIRNLVLGWIQQYVLDQDKAILTLLQLFVDLSSYQYVNLEQLLRFNDTEDIVPHLESTNNSVLLETDKYFLFVRNKSFRSKHAKIEEFLIVLILICAKQNIINFMIKPVAKFVIEMANSQVRAIRHTGVYIGLKIQTALIDLISQYSTRIHRNSEKLDATTDQALNLQIENKLTKYKENCEILTVHLSYLNENIFIKNIRNADSKLYHMREDCIMELKRWIDIFPDRYLNQNCINFIAKAIKDSNKNVRIRAIDLLTEIIDRYYEEISDFAPNYLSIIIDRVMDSNYTVAIHAVEAITIFCNKVPVTSSIHEAIMPDIFSDNFNLAASCGRFYAAQFQKVANKYNSDIEFGIYILKNIVKFEQYNNNKDYYLSYLVEALYDPLPVLQNISLYLEFLKKPNLSDFIVEIILRILVEIVHIGYFGTCTLARKLSRKQKVRIEQKQTLTNEMIKALPNLREIYSTKQLKQLLIIINQN